MRPCVKFTLTKCKFRQDSRSRGQANLSTVELVDHTYDGGPHRGWTRVVYYTSVDRNALTP